MRILRPLTGLLCLVFTADNAAIGNHNSGRRWRRASTENIETESQLEGQYQSIGPIPCALASSQYIAELCRFGAYG